jgi:hypothetical protein
MRLRRPTITLGRLQRLGIVAPTLIGYLLIALGVPCPAIARVIKDTSIPFPCQDKLCGCMNAEQFWAGCCCMTMSERLAWAKDHQVPPPANVEEPKRSCCSVEAPDDCPMPCCAKKKSGATGPKSCCEPPKPTQAAQSKPAKPRVGCHARQCGGTASYWLTVSPAGPPDAWQSWNYEWTPAEWVPFLHVWYQQFSSVPVPPPPRG